MEAKTKVIAVAYILFVVACSSFIIYHETGDEDSSRDVVAAIARVNTDGSGIYLKSVYDPEDFYTYEDGEYTFNADMWGGRVFGTPGVPTIQHVQLQQIADSMGLKFEGLSASTVKRTDTLYYVSTVTNATAATETSSEILDGGILWEPQYSMIISNPMYQGMLLTNDMFSGHTCCVIAGSTEFMKNNPDATVAFLAAYVKAVDYVNAAKADRGSDEYGELVRICEKYTGLKESVIEDALFNVEFKFSDDNRSGSLDNLVGDIASLESDLEAAGNISVSMSSLGFDDSTEFAELLVQDSYLTNAVSGDVAKPSGKRSVTVAAINGDIHQIAIRVAQELGYFSEYNLDVTVGALGNGGAVALDILGGYSDFAFLGAPPLTINVVNGGYLSA